MRALVMIMNPRRIAECIESFERLDRVDLAWLTGYRLAELVDVVAEVVAGSDHDALLMCADDCVVSQGAVDAVLSLLEAGHPTATGWCRLATGDARANITRAPVTGDVPTEEAYDWYLADEVLAWPEPAVPTGFMGMALTGMPRALWERFPFGVYGSAGHGWSSDFNLTVRLRDAGIPMVAARDGYVDHVKERWLMADADPRKRLVVGEVPAGVMIDRWEEVSGRCG